MGFIVDWSKSRKNADFLEKQNKALNKWEKRNGKKPVRPLAAAAAAAPHYAHLFAVAPGSSQDPTHETENEIPTGNDEQMDEERDEPATAASPINNTTPAIQISPIPPTIRVPPINSPYQTRTQMIISPPPAAGPSNRRQDAVHIYPSFARLADSSDDEPIATRKRTHHPIDDDEDDTDFQIEDERTTKPKKPQTRMGMDYETRDPRTQPPTNELPSQPAGGRREANPTGEYYDPPCSQCRRRASVCEKELYVAACVRCYVGKNKCDFGGRRREEPAKFTRRRKLPTEKTATIIESEDEMIGHKFKGPASGERPAKRVKIAAADDGEEENPTGDDTAKTPPPQPSSPKPRRVAAEKAAAAIAAKRVLFAGIEDDEQENEDEAAPTPTLQPSSSKPRRVAATKARAAVAAALKMDNKFREPSKARKTYGKTQGIY
jgi:hypothetical protein